MAVKITTSGFLTIDRPIEKYSIDRIAEVLQTESKYVMMEDMGVFVLAVDTDPTKILNSVSSLYFRFAVFGHSLVISGKELPEDNQFISDENTKFEINDFESGLLSSIRDTLETYQLIMGGDITQEAYMRNPNPTQGDVPQDSYPTKKLYYFDPMRKCDISDEEKQFINEFYLHAVDILKNIPIGRTIEDLVIYEDPEVIIKFKPDAIKETLNTMMAYYLENEEYEKCAVIRDVIEKTPNL